MYSSLNTQSTEASNSNALKCTDDRIIVAEHNTGTVKLRARCFSHPALTDEAMIGKPDTAKGTIINAFAFLCHTHTPSDWLNNELPLL